MGSYSVPRNVDDGQICKQPQAHTHTQTNASLSPFQNVFLLPFDPSLSWRNCRLLTTTTTCDHIDMHLQMATGATPLVSMVKSPDASSSFRTLVREPLSSQVFN
jgi:hypothetical protein